MARREFQEKHPRQREDQAEAVAPAAGQTATAEGVKLKAELDGLLDEIDEVLEDNAEDFVKAYIQKGGE